MTVATQDRTLSWEMLVYLEPRLKRLLDEARTMPTNNGYCANQAWYARRTGFKARMGKLVGFSRKSDHATLCTSWAYEVAYRQIFNALPPCRHADPCR